VPPKHRAQVVLIGDPENALQKGKAAEPDRIGLAEQLGG